MTKKKTFDGRAVLAAQMHENDANAGTVGAYLIALLRAIWSEGEGFNGKRPFGNSGWDYDLAKPLIAAGLIRGTLDRDGYVDSCNEDDLRDAVETAIAALWP